MLDHANLLRGAPPESIAFHKAWDIPKAEAHMFCVAVRTNLFSPCNYYAFESVAVRFFKCRIYTTPFLRQHSMQYIQTTLYIWDTHEM